MMAKGADGLTFVPRMVVRFKGQARLGRWVTAGAVGLGLPGAGVGLVVGLIVHPPTAPFALVELGLPATVVGAAAGVVAGTAEAAWRRIRRNPTPPLGPFRVRRPGQTGGDGPRPTARRR